MRIDPFTRRPQQFYAISFIALPLRIAEIDYDGPLEPRCKDGIKQNNGTVHECDLILEWYGDGWFVIDIHKSLQHDAWLRNARSKSPNSEMPINWIPCSYRDLFGEDGNLVMAEKMVEAVHNSYLADSVVELV